MSDDDFNTWQKKLFAAVIIAAISGNAGFILNKATPQARNDPFTGSEGREMEHRLDRVDAIQQTMLFRMKRQEEGRKECEITINEHLRRHP